MYQILPPLGWGLFDVTGVSWYVSSDNCWVRHGKKSWWDCIKVIKVMTACCKVCFRDVEKDANTPSLGSTADIERTSRDGGCCRLLRSPRADEKDTEPPHAPNDLLTLLEQPWWPTLGMRCWEKSLRKADSRPRIIRCERKNRRGSEIVLLGLVIHGLLRASFQLRTSVCCTPITSKKRGTHF